MASNVSFAPAAMPQLPRLTRISNWHCWEAVASSLTASVLTCSRSCNERMRSMNTSLWGRLPVMELGALVDGRWTLVVDNDAGQNFNHAGHRLDFCKDDV